MPNFVEKAPNICQTSLVLLTSMLALEPEDVCIRERASTRGRCASMCVGGSVGSGRRGGGT